MKLHKNIFRYTCFFIIIIVSIIFINYTLEGFKTCTLKQNKIINTIEKKNIKCLSNLIKNHRGNKNYINLPRLTFYHKNQPDSIGKIFPIDYSNNELPPPIKIDTNNKKKHKHYSHICKKYAKCSDIQSYNDCLHCKFNNKKCEIKDFQCTESDS